jgi:hypothetical protein
MNQITNALHGLEQAKGKDKIGYVVLLVLGILFFVSAVSTAVSLFQITQVKGFSTVFSSYEGLVMMCYVILNFIAGVGLTFCRRWIVTIFLINTVGMFATAVWFFVTSSSSGRVSTPFTAGVLSLLLLLITFVCRKYLTVSNQSRIYLSVYVIVMLVTVYTSFLF